MICLYDSSKTPVNSLDFESMLSDYNSLPHWRETWGSFER